MRDAPYVSGRNYLFISNALFAEENKLSFTVEAIKSLAYFAYLAFSIPLTILGNSYFFICYNNAIKINKNKTMNKYLFINYKKL